MKHYFEELFLSIQLSLRLRSVVGQKETSLTPIHCNTGMKMIKNAKPKDCEEMSVAGFRVNPLD